jgi:hypothetical protein
MISYFLDNGFGIIPSIRVISENIARMKIILNDYLVLSLKLEWNCAKNNLEHDYWEVSPIHPTQPFTRLHG